MIAVRHQLLPKQDQLIYSTCRHTCYSGAVGAGKSRALCIDALIHTAGRPKTRYGLFRKTLAALRKSTLKTLIEGDGDAPPVLPPGSYTHNKTLCEIRVNDGGSILYTGVETPEAVRSMNLSRAGVDEVTELDEEEYNAVDDRVRMKVGGPLCVVSATNPSTPSHWMAEMMGISPNVPEAVPGCKIILTKTADNTFLDPDYIAGFERHRGTLYYRRMFLGQWCGAEGLIYEGWSQNRHVRAPAFPARRIWLGVDDGMKNDPFVVVRMEEDDEGRVCITDEVFEHGLIQSEKIEVVRTLADDAWQIVVDNSAPDLIETMRRANLPAIPCHKGAGSILGGIAKVSDRLAKEVGGVPRLTVHPGCLNTIREFETYEWKTRPKASGKSSSKYMDEPYGANDHSLDAIRYVVREIDGDSGSMIYPEPTGSVIHSPPDDDEWMWN